MTLKKKVTIGSKKNLTCQPEIMMDISTKTYFSDCLADDFKPMDDGLDEIRKIGLQQFKKSGMPTSKNEEYKYTKITKVLEKVFNEQTEEVR